MSGVKPIIRGEYINTAALLETLQSTSSDTGTDVASIYNNIHNILHYVDRRDPLGPTPANPASDPQYRNWEFGVQQWKISQFGALLGVSPTSSATSTETEETTETEG